MYGNGNNVRTTWLLVYCVVIQLLQGSCCLAVTRNGYRGRGTVRGKLPAMFVLARYGVFDGHSCESVCGCCLPLQRGTNDTDLFAGVQGEWLGMKFKQRRRLTSGRFELQHRRSGKRQKGTDTEQRQVLETSTGSVTRASRARNPRFLGLLVTGIDVPLLSVTVADAVAVTSPCTLCCAASKKRHHPYCACRFVSSVKQGNTTAATSAELSEALIRGG